MLLCSQFKAPRYLHAWRLHDKSLGLALPREIPSWFDPSLQSSKATTLHVSWMMYEFVDSNIRLKPLLVSLLTSRSESETGTFPGPLRRCSCSTVAWAWHMIVGCTSMTRQVAAGASVATQGVDHQWLACALLKLHISLVAAYLKLCTLQCLCGLAAHHSWPQCP